MGYKNPFIFGAVKNDEHVNMHSQYKNCVQILII